MSERENPKITPLHPQRARRQKLRKRLRIVAVIAAIVLVALALFLFRRELDFDRFRRWVTYMGMEPDSSESMFHYPAYDGNVYAVYENGLLVASGSEVLLYDEQGGRRDSLTVSMEAPNADVEGTDAVVWDMGGTAICTIRDGKELLNQSVDRMILDADVSVNGEVVYATAADGYRTMLTLLDNQTQERFKWYSSAQYLPLCAVNGGGSQLAAVALGQENGAFASSLMLLDPSVAEQEPVQIALGNQLIYDLDYLNDRYLCAVGESSLQLFRTSGEACGTYSYNGDHLMKYDTGGDGFVVLALNPYQAGSQYTLKTVEYNGQERASLVLGQEVQQVSAAGDYVAVLTASELQIYTSDLQLYAKTDEVLGVSKVCMREDGTAVLVGEEQARLFLP